MSAITRSTQRYLPGLTHYHTSVKVEVASHNSPERVDVSADVWSCSVGKTIKGAGRANISLVAGRNFLNLLFPDDYVNIYFDIGDGQGWTRVFFGLIDRIEEAYDVSEAGVPSTVYHVICTDFTKVFDKTFVYFNPALRNRADWINSDFSQGNIGGLAALSRGLVLSGSPADIVQNFILVMLGFGTQMVLPESYRPRVSDEFRTSRRRFITDQLNSAPLRTAVDPDVLQTLNERLLRQSDDTSAPPLTEEERAEIGIEGTEAITRTADQLRADVLRNLALRELDVGGDSPAFLLDIIDLYTFVERNGIDGYRTALEMMENTGDLMSTIRQYSNEVVNEVFFDLRPVMSDGGLRPGDSFSHEADDWGGNVSGSHPAGIQYVPALVMREYPFSTINRVDASTVQMRLGPDSATYGVMWCGALFSNEKDVPGRHVIRIPSVAIDQQTQGSASTTADKHLDVVVLSENEIVKTRWGRSDEDHFNLFELHTNAIMGSVGERYLFGDLLPLITPIDIMRHGLRIKQADTMYAYFGNQAVVQSQTDTTEPTQPEDEEEEEGLSTEVGPPILASDGAVYRGRRSALSVSARYGYRRGTRPDTSDSWIFHNGIDIHPTSTETVDGVAHVKGPPVRAMADGFVCVSAPNGTYGLYGETVVIRHPQFGDRPVYSAYNHLFGRNTDVVGNAENHNQPRQCCSLNGGRFEERQVSRGDIIGWMGKTGANRDGSAQSGVRLDPNRPGVTGLIASGVHLHFEIDYSFPPRNETETPRIPFSAVRPVSTNSRSTDPDAFLMEHSVDLVALYTADDGVDDDAEEGGGEDAVTDDHARDTSQRTETDEDEQRQTSPAESDVDNRAIRNMLARWTILQDHWYQHNKEYLSGDLTVRPAPEIRVGYRLDIPERAMSFYIEGVQHDWQHPNKMTTNLQVTRGQPNNPYPVYVLPPIEGLANPATQRRNADSRLARYFVTSDPIAVRRALVLRQSALTRESAATRTSALVTVNVVDQEAADGTTETVIPASIDGFDEVAVSLASEETLDAVDAALATPETAPFITGGGDDLDHGGVIEAELFGEWGDE